ncbi:hypothetical protein PGT21_036778 [Puccinia graminis f. sp. tritici]|uniref:Chromo domain-containing protein n=1 Tax=Puccinia graminis f. sp. tritici TaxID=56615 RepID=A0A5B0PMV0_PUCGR|nr:hypothetical protein PGT21_036778 [Puccinia graminis f. sp. tritici]
MKRKTGRGKLWEAIEILEEKGGKYYIKWAGIDPATQEPWEPTWEPKSMANAALVADWRSKNRTQDLSKVASHHFVANPQKNPSPDVKPMSNPPAQDSSNSPELSLCRATNYSLANPDDTPSRTDLAPSSCGFDPPGQKRLNWAIILSPSTNPQPNQPNPDSQHYIFNS